MHSVTGLAHPTLGGEKGAAAPLGQPRTQPGSHSKNHLKHLGHKGKQELQLLPPALEVCFSRLGLYLLC